MQVHTFFVQVVRLGESFSIWARPQELEKCRAVFLVSQNCVELVRFCSILEGLGEAPLSGLVERWRGLVFALDAGLQHTVLESPLNIGRFARFYNDDLPFLRIAVLIEAKVYVCLCANMSIIDAKTVRLVGFRRSIKQSLPLLFISKSTSFILIKVLLKQRQWILCHFLLQKGRFRRKKVHDNNFMVY